MLRSMTGFGKADGEFDGDVISVEVSAVNHRYLDCSVRLPNAWNALESVLRETVRKHMARGKVYVAVNRKRGPDSRRQTVVLDGGLARQYIDAARDLVQLSGKMDTLSVDVLAQLEGVFYQEEPEDDLNQVKDALLRVTTQALGRADAMRVTEGEALAEEVAGRVALIREALTAIEGRLPELNALYEQRLRTRIEELQRDAELTEERIAIEIALMADKGDVTEEVVRIKTHLDHALELLEKEEPVGRELNFLTQELQREVNTLGSKVRDSAVVKEVLRMKSELERFREQVQNIE